LNLRLTTTLGFGLLKLDEIEWWGTEDEIERLKIEQNWF
jgi:hypothetical protein